MIMLLPLLLMMIMVMIMLMMIMVLMNIMLLLLLIIVMMMIITLMMYSRRMAITMTYYGVTMNADNLGGDFHINFILLGLAEVVGTVLAITVLNKIGRRWTTAGSFVLAGIACLATIPCLFVMSKGTLS